eukprot:g7363.t1
MQPRFHVRSNCTGCKMSDPDFPFHDPRHGNYHLMFQFHQPGSEVVIGHVVSADMVRWARLPVALTNDTWHDREAIWTGSATIVNGTPWLVYPGRCVPGVAGCGATGFNYAQATPADPAGDPLYEAWRKTEPILNDTFDDPSTAWRSPATGEWRFIGNARVGGPATPRQSPLFAAASWCGPWRRVGLVDGMPWGECPSLYPLPPLTPGRGAAGTAGLPTHVHKRSRQTHNCSGDCSGDVATLGTWVDGAAPGDVGTWQATAGVPFAPAILDAGNRYASKDFWDPARGRRINWGWVHVPGGGQSLPRVQTYNPATRALEHAPLPELAQLHTYLLARVAGRVGVPPHGSLALGDAARLAAGPGNSSDANVTFAIPGGDGFLSLTSRPAACSRVGLRVMQDAAGQGGVLAYVEWPAGQPVDRSRAVNVTVGFDPPCFACQSATATLTLLPSDAALELRVFCDRTIVEAYWQGGRVAMTTGGPSDDGTWGSGGARVRGAMSIEAGAGGAEVLAATVFAMGSIWLPKELMPVRT